MPIPKKYFHDRLVVLLLGINIFLTLFGTLLVLLRLDSSRGSYILEFRANYGVGDYRQGSSLDVLTFVIFLFINLAIAVMLSMRTYNIRRHVAVLMLGLSIFLALLTIIVTNSLLVSR